MFSMTWSSAVTASASGVLLCFETQLRLEYIISRSFWAIRKWRLGHGPPDAKRWYGLSEDFFRGDPGSGGEIPTIQIWLGDHILCLVARWQHLRLVRGHTVSVAPFHFAVTASICQSSHFWFVSKFAVLSASYQKAAKNNSLRFAGLSVRRRPKLTRTVFMYDRDTGFSVASLNVPPEGDGRKSPVNTADDPRIGQILALDGGQGQSVTCMAFGSRYPDVNWHNKEVKYNRFENIVKNKLLLATGLSNGDIKIWEVASGKILCFNFKILTVAC